MKRIGEYWVPDVDTFFFRNLRKTKANYEGGGHGTQIGHLKDALAEIRKRVGAEAMAASVAIDAGANVGAYARHMAEVFSHVHAFEPAPDTFACLARNIQDWGLSSSVTPRPEALSSQMEGVSMASGGLLRRSISRAVKGPGDIPAITIDSLELSDVLFLKLDVEGYELKVLQGASETLTRCAPFVMMEMKQRKIERGTADMAPHECLTARGYTVCAKLGEPVIDWLYAPMRYAD